MVSGVRRCGKSTLLRQISEGFPHYLYLNLDDERLVGASIQDLSLIAEIWEEHFPGVRELFLDEVQNVKGWERYVRRLHDDGYKIFLTGSNAHLLIAELGTQLAGRYVKIELYPLGLMSSAGSILFPQGGIRLSGKQRSSASSHVISNQAVFMST